MKFGDPNVKLGRGISGSRFDKAFHKISGIGNRKLLPKTVIEVQEMVLNDYREAGSDVKEQPGFLVAIGNLAVSYSDAGRHEDALKLHRERLDISSKTSA